VILEEIRSGGDPAEDHPPTGGLPRMTGLKYSSRPEKVSEQLDGPGELS
jgi:hypothetical protein